MPTNPVDQQIRSRIEAFVDEIAVLVRSSAMDAVRSALGGNGTATAPARRGPGRPPGKKAGKAAKATKAGLKRGRGRRSSESVQQIADQIEASVRAKPGRRLGEIAAELGMTSPDLSRSAQNLVAAGRVRTEGQRGGTRYFPGGGGGSRKAGRKTGKKAGKRGRKASRRRERRKKAKAGAAQIAVA